jgi:hypothetical protein
VSSGSCTPPSRSSRCRPLQVSLERRRSAQPRGAVGVPAGKFDVNGERASSAVQRAPVPSAGLLRQFEIGEGVGGPRSGGARAGAVEGLPNTRELHRAWKGLDGAHPARAWARSRGAWVRRERRTSSASAPRSVSVPGPRGLAELGLVKMTGDRSKVDQQQRDDPQPEPVAGRELGRPVEQQNDDREDQRPELLIPQAGCDG